MKGYFAESENVFMFLMTYFFAIAKDIVLFKIYFKSLVLRFEIVSDKIFSVIPIFTALILLLLFQIIKIRHCCGFTFTNFFFFPYSHQRFFSKQNLVLKVYWNFQVNSMPISTLMTILSGDVIQCFLKENNKNNKDKK